MRSFRLIPRITYRNLRREYPSAGSSLWQEWCCLTRYWSGRLFVLRIKHHAFTFDFRRNVLKDLIGDR